MANTCFLAHLLPCLPLKRDLVSFSISFPFLASALASNDASSTSCARPESCVANSQYGESRHAELRPTHRHCDFLPIGSFGGLFQDLDAVEDHEELWAG